MIVMKDKKILASTGLFSIMIMGILLVILEPQETAFGFDTAGGFATRICDADRVIANCLGAMDADVTITVNVDTKIHYAFRLDDEDGHRLQAPPDPASGGNTDWEFQINAGAFLDLTTTSTGAKLTTSDDSTFVDSQGVTSGERLTTGGFGAYIAGGNEHETSSILQVDIQIRDNHGESQASILLVTADLNNNDTITFRVIQGTKDGNFTLVGLAVITISKTAGDVNADQFMNTGCCLFLLVETFDESQLKQSDYFYDD